MLARVSGIPVGSSGTAVPGRRVLAVVSGIPVGSSSTADRPRVSRRTRNRCPPATVPAGLPQDVPAGQVRHPGEDEQQVGEPVEVGRREDVHPALALGRAGLGTECLDGRPRRPLRTAGHRRRDVQVGGGEAAAGQDERAQRLQPLEVGVAVGLELVHPLLAHPQRGVLIGRLERGREVGADVEEVVLHPLEGGPDVVGDRSGREDDADRGIRLVGVGVCREPRVGLARAAEVAERRRPVVAGPGVDPGEVDHGDSLSFLCPIFTAA